MIEKTEEMGLYYKVKGDHRWHMDTERYNEIRKGIPSREDDTCPNCGNKEGVIGCRCPNDHRYCPECHFTYHWQVNRDKACLEIVPD